MRLESPYVQYEILEGLSLRFKQADRVTDWAEIVTKRDI